MSMQRYQNSSSERTLSAASSSPTATEQPVPALRRRLASALTFSASSLPCVGMLGVVVLASEVEPWLVDYDMDPMAAGFAIFCAVLFTLLLGTIITLSLFSEDKKRAAMYQSEWVDQEQEVAMPEAEEESIEPFISDPDTPAISSSVAEMFGVEEATHSSQSRRA